MALSAIVQVTRVRDARTGAAERIMIEGYVHDSDGVIDAGTMWAFKVLPGDATPAAIEDARGWVERETLKRASKGRR